MPPKKRIRRQRVVLRLRRREALKHRIRAVLWRSVAFAVAGGFVLGMVAGGDSFLVRFVRRHTPTLVVIAPKALAGLPIVEELPTRRFLLWFPGTGVQAAGRLVRKFPAVRGVQFERRFRDSRIIVRVEPRSPLARWNERGLDSEGVVFPLDPGAWNQLPKVALGTDIPPSVVGPWLAELCRWPDLWNQVVAISDDRRGEMLLTLHTGAQLIWGDPEIGKAREKARWLCKVLEDAHENLGGAARADLRFFDEGRIIVRPKG